MVLEGSIDTMNGGGELLPTNEPKDAVAMFSPMSVATERGGGPKTPLTEPPTVLEKRASAIVESRDVACATPCDSIRMYANELAASKSISQSRTSSKTSQKSHGGSRESRGVEPSTPLAIMVQTIRRGGGDGGEEPEEEAREGPPPADDAAVATAALASASTSAPSAEDVSIRSDLSASHSSCHVTQTAPALEAALSPVPIASAQDPVPTPPSPRVTLITVTDDDECRLDVAPSDFKSIDTKDTLERSRSNESHESVEIIAEEKVIVADAPADQENVTWGAEEKLEQEEPNKAQEESVAEGNVEVKAVMSAERSTPAIVASLAKQGASKVETNVAAVEAVVSNGNEAGSKRKGRFGLKKLSETAAAALQRNKPTSPRGLSLSKPPLSKPSLSMRKFGKTSLVKKYMKGSPATNPSDEPKQELKQEPNQGTNKHSATAVMQDELLKREKVVLEDPPKQVMTREDPKPATLVTGLKVAQTPKPAHKPEIKSEMKSEFKPEIKSEIKREIKPELEKERKQDPMQEAPTQVHTQESNQEPAGDTLSKKAGSVTPAAPDAPNDEEPELKEEDMETIDLGAADNGVPEVKESVPALPTMPPTPPPIETSSSIPTSQPAVQTKQSFSAFFLRQNNSMQAKETEARDSEKGGEGDAEIQVKPQVTEVVKGSSSTEIEEVMTEKVVTPTKTTPMADGNTAESNSETVEVQETTLNFIEALYAKAEWCFGDLTNTCAAGSKTSLATKEERDELMTAEELAEHAKLTEATMRALGASPPNSPMSASQGAAAAANTNSKDWADHAFTMVTEVATACSTTSAADSDKKGSKIQKETIDGPSPQLAAVRTSSKEARSVKFPLDDILTPLSIATERATSFIDEVQNNTSIKSIVENFLKGVDDVSVGYENAVKATEEAFFSVQTTKEAQAGDVITNTKADVVAVVTKVMTQEKMTSPAELKKKTDREKNLGGDAEMVNHVLGQLTDEPVTKEGTQEKMTLPAEPKKKSEREEKLDRAAEMAKRALDKPVNEPEDIESDDKEEGAKKSRALFRKPTSKPNVPLPKLFTTATPSPVTSPSNDSSKLPSLLPPMSNIAPPSQPSTPQLSLSNLKRGISTKTKSMAPSRSKSVISPEMQPATAEVKKVAQSSFRRFKRPSSMAKKSSRGGFWGRKDGESGLFTGEEEEEEVANEEEASFNSQSLDEPLSPTTDNPDVIEVDREKLDKATSEEAKSEATPADPVTEEIKKEETHAVPEAEKVRVHSTKEEIPTAPSQGE